MRGAISTRCGQAQPRNAKRPAQLLDVVRRLEQMIAELLRPDLDDFLARGKIAAVLEPYHELQEPLIETHELLEMASSIMAGRFGLPPEASASGGHAQ